MSLRKYNKLKLVRQASLQHEVLTASLLEKLEIGRQLRHKYTRSGWLESLGRGAYKVPGSTVTWEGATSALQQQLELPVHPGAKTVFQLLGLAHYLGQTRIYLYCPTNTSLPSWFKNLRCFATTELKVVQGNPITDWDLGFVTRDTLRMSSFERAILEQLSLVGRTEGFDESYKLFESLTNLRPQLLQSLLESCSSIKTKRLFFYMAENLNYAWFKKLDPNKLDFGSGPREIVKGGSYNAKYKIIVPPGDTI